MFDNGLERTLYIYVVVVVGVAVVGVVVAVVKIIMFPSGDFELVRFSIGKKIFFFLNLFAFCINPPGEVTRNTLMVTEKRRKDRKIKNGNSLVDVCPIGIHYAFSDKAFANTVIY